MTSIKSYKKRTYLDPIHGPIELDLSDPVENLLSKIIDTREFQKLRRIKQMGLGWFTFHGAEHTRFGHSIGTMFMASKMINHLSKKHFEVNKYELQILCAALLHDIGHGPFSHTAEKLIGVSHESWTRKIITGDTGINSLLKDFDKNLPLTIVQVLEYKNFPLFVSQLVSSYIDCDRLDYLHRDSYYVGVPYGLTGSDRIISSLDINSEDKRLVISETIGLDAVVHYLQARYSMYQQIYQHKKNLASDFLLRKIIERIREVKPKISSKAFYEWLNLDDEQIEKMNVESYYQVDDFLLISTVQALVNDPTTEKILKDLGSRFTSRNIFKSLEFRQEVTKEKTNEFLEKASSITKQKDLNPNYYLGIEQSASKPYEPYLAKDKETSKAIFIKQQNGLVKELTEVSGLIKALSQENVVKTCLVFAQELEDDVNSIKGFSELFK